MSRALKYGFAGAVVVAALLAALSAYSWVSLSDLRVRHAVLEEKYSALQARYGSLSKEYEGLMRRFETLSTNYSTLKEEYVKLGSTYDSLKRSYAELSSKYSALKGNYSALREAYSALTANYSKLREAYASLRSNYSTLYKEYSSTLTKLNEVEGKYDALKSKYSELQAAYGTLSTELESLRSNYTSLRNQYVSLKNEYLSLKKGVEELMNVTQERGGLIDSLKPNYIDWWSDTVEEAVRSINFNAYGDPYKAIYEWILNHIYYNFDTPEVVLLSVNGTYEWVTDYYQYASETLSNGYGDCEDQAILAAAMVEAYWHMKYGETYLIYVVEAAVKYGGSEYGHDFLIIPFQGGDIAILDTTLQAYIPPTSPQQALNEYEWKTGVTITYVYGVFSTQQYYHIGANTLSEFINWLNTH